jgi:hypothetical protein
MCLAGSLAIFASSCKKNQEQLSVEVTLPSFEEAMGDVDEADKAYIDFNNGATFHWNGKDKIMVYNICNDDHQKSIKGVFEAQTNAEGHPTGKFWSVDGVDLGNKLDHYYIFYPVERIKFREEHTLGVYNREYFVVPREQYYSYDPNGKPTIDPAAMAMVGETYDLTSQVMMQHIFGICRLRLEGTAVVDSIKLVGKPALSTAVNNDGLNGEASLRINAVDSERFNQILALYLQMPTQQESYINAWYDYNHNLGLAYAPIQGHNGDDDSIGRELVLICNDDERGLSGINLDDSDSYTPFYFSVRPGAFVYGFNIFVYYRESPTATAEYVQEIIAFNNPNNEFKSAYCIQPGKVTGIRPKYTAAQAPLTGYVTIPDGTGSLVP